MQDQLDGIVGQHQPKACVVHVALSDVLFREVKLLDNSCQK